MTVRTKITRTCNTFVILQPTASYQHRAEAYMIGTHAKTISIVLNGTLCNIHLWVRALCQFVSVSKGVLAWAQQTAQPLFDPALLLATNGAGGSPILPCFLSPSSAPSVSAFRKKTMASTSSVSQVSAWTWSWDNLPRSSFLVHQMKASVCPSLVSFTFSHLLRTFIIQIRMLSGKTDGRMDGWCCRPRSPRSSPRATKRRRVAFEGPHLYHKPPEDGGSHSPWLQLKKLCGFFVWLRCL